MNINELPSDHLATTDQEGHRVYLYPQDVAGKFRSLRSGVSTGLILLFLALPWLKVAGKPAILLDIAGRRFSILGLMFWAHDAPMLFFIFGGIVFSWAFVTAVWGRVWCGWACPQTVFVDSVFRKIERWIEGDWRDRKKLDQGNWTLHKILLKGLKWLIFGAISLVISHSFLAYFVGPQQIGQMLRSSPSEYPASFLVMGFVTSFSLFDFGWFREQFCVVVCPYARFQSVLMDDESMVVYYDTSRGEPRKSSVTDLKNQGDCISCYRCVGVCPTGIDIRRGTQLECIACTACMDACDAVMTRFNKPRGLIRYDALAGKTKKAFSVFRPRPMFYLVIITILVAGLVVTLRGRQDISADFIRGIEAPYQEIVGPGGSAWVVNHFRVDLRNQSFASMQPRIALPETLRSQGAEMIMAPSPPRLDAGANYRMDIFVRFPKILLKMGKLAVPIQVAFDRKDGSGAEIIREVKLVGPFN
ncbi:cytochrome c oxidase accessory protein CcoG [Bdellovibrionota bacterium FG-1]